MALRARVKQVTMGDRQREKGVVRQILHRFIIELFFVGSVLGSLSLRPPLEV